MGMTTLCYVEKDNAYLMMHRIKKEKDINKDKWVGVGGKFEHGESPEDCLLREAMEETGLTLTSFRFCGIVTFLSDMGTDKEATEHMCLYHCDGFEGKLIDCNEGVLEWVPKKDVRKLNLWEGDYLFFDLIDQKRDFFSLKVEYVKGKLINAVLDNKKLKI